ncbi:MAG: hypothetical protein KTR16_16605 [Acidiferrobacterales bacterium]|nr:hypothetical protein [Acidiferrobacterales bacterium]
MANDPTDTTKYPLGTSDLYAAARNAGDLDKGLNAGNTTFTNRFGQVLPTFEKALTDAKTNYGGLNNTGGWVTSTAYAVNDLWQSTVDDTWYLVLTAYTSGANEASDIATGNVEVWQGISRSESVVKVASVSDLASTTLAEGQAVELIGYHEGANVGGGSGVIKSSRHDGVFNFSLSRTFPLDWDDQAQLAAWYLDSGADELCFSRTKESKIINVIDGGLKEGGDATLILSNANYSKFRVTLDEIKVGEIERDVLEMELISCSIDAVESTSVMFKNIRNFRMTARGSCSLCENTAPSSYVYNVESGNNLDVLMLGGDLVVNCQDTCGGFHADSGVSSSHADGDMIVHVADGVEIKNFVTSGVDLRCSAMSSGSYVYVGGSKSHSGSGRCLQFGDNDNGMNNVTIEDCPRIGEVFSGGSAEAKGILVYGRNTTVDNVRITDVSNESASGGEGLYLKSSFSSISNVKMKNAGSSADGCLTLKGSSYFGDTYPDEGEYSTISNVRIEVDDSGYDTKGIGVFDSFVNVSDVLLLDRRSDKSALTKDQALSIGGSAPVSNVTVQRVTSNGWNNFCGDFADSSKGRCRFGDNIKFADNTAFGLADDGYFVVWRADCQLSSITMSFVASDSSLNIDGGLAQNQEFGAVYPLGSKVVITGTASNDGTYTVASVSRYKLTFDESVIDEASVSTTISRESVNSLKITGNSADNGGTAIRSAAGTVDSLLIDDNSWKDFSYIYRIDTANATKKTYIGAGEQYTNVTDPTYGTPVATEELSWGVSVVGDSGSAVTIAYNQTERTITYD